MSFLVKFEGAGVYCQPKSLFHRKLKSNLKNQTRTDTKQWILNITSLTLDSTNSFSALLKYQNLVTHKFIGLSLKRVKCNRFNNILDKRALSTNYINNLSKLLRESRLISHSSLLLKKNLKQIMTRIQAHFISISNYTMKSVDNYNIFHRLL